MTQSQSGNSESQTYAAIIVPWQAGTTPPSESQLEETRGLAIALGCEVKSLQSQKLRQISPSHFLSKGLLTALKEEFENLGVGLLIVDTALTPVQQRSLEADLNVKVIDRTGLILEIFGLRARTREGAIQVELARLMYERSRLVRTWTHLERQRGGGGFLSGPGESQLEADRRMIDGKIVRMRADLDAIRRTRSVQRSSRTRADRPLVALVGYTNAGKSTLFNALTGAGVFAKDMPFATLDPTIRAVDLDITGNVSFIDTVGFISNLPTHLIESFNATLEEVVSADLILHVRDRASEADADQKADVLSVLEQLRKANDVLLPEIIEVWNKSDRLAAERREALEMAARSDPNVVMVSAVTGEGLPELRQTVDRHLSNNSRQVSVNVPAEDGRQRAWLYENGKVVGDTTQDDGGVALDVILSARRFAVFSEMFPDADVTVSGL